MTIKEFARYIPKRIDKNIEAYCHSIMPHYLIYKRISKKTAAVRCTQCGKVFEMPATALRHNAEISCPKCGASVTVKAEGRVSTLRNELYFVYFSRSKLDPNAIIARGIYAIRRCGSWPRAKPETQYKVEDAYLFRLGEPTEHYQWSWWRSTGVYKGFRPEEYLRVKAVSDRSDAAGLSAINHFADMKSYASAISGTMWERFFPPSLQLCRHQLLTYLDFAARHPAVEYLVKMGLTGLLRPYMDKTERSYGAINWRGKNAQGILRLKMKDIKQLMHKSATNCELLKLMQIDRAKGGSLTAEQLKRLSMYHVPEIEELGEWTSITRYLLGQKGYIGNTTRDLKDYWRDCAALNLDLTKDSVKWPRDLIHAHELTTKAIKVKADAVSNAMIARNIRKLGNAYTYEYGELLIRPARDTDELIAEGQALRHCVASYAKRYAAGEITICVIRKTADPTTPYYTAEFTKDGTLAQCRGLRNCSMTPEVKEFIDAIKPRILKALRRMTA